MVLVKALLFDVFGTVVDWRTNVVSYISDRLDQKLDKTIDWNQFTEDWRREYYEFTQKGSRSEATSNEFLTVDQQHRITLEQLVQKYGFLDQVTSSELDDLTMAWHNLKGWDDTVEGLKLLKSQFIIGTLSNGNTKLLVDMAKYADLQWDVIFGGDTFKAYKPSSKMYLGAAELLQIDPENIVMVAAHIYDLKAAKSFGFQTAYIVRQGEDVGKVVGRDEVDFYTNSLVDLFKQLTA
ncbi:HAD-like domain-containing protein [Dipodascopsis uninucleata]